MQSAAGVKNQDEDATTKLLILRLNESVEKEEIPAASPFFFFFSFVFIIVMINYRYYVFTVTNGEFSAVCCCQ